PAAILTFPSGEAARAKTKPSKRAEPPKSAQAAAAPLPVQPELDGLKPHSAPAVQAAPAAPSRRTTPAAAPARKPKSRARTAERKPFVLDTNVLLHDPSSLFRFEEHDIFLPMMT